MKPKATMTALLATTAMLAAALPGTAGAQEALTVRMMSLGTGIPFLITSAWKELGLDKKHGIELKVEHTGNLSGQWIAVRNGAADMVLGNFLDILRQHKAGLKIQAFQFCYNYDDPIVTLAGKPYAKLADLKGVQVGVTRSTFQPVLLYRIAGKKAYGFDFVQEAKVSEASPSLLPQMLRSGQLEVTYSFRSLVFDDLLKKRAKEVANLKQVLDDAGWNIPLTLYVLSDAWREKAGPQGVRKLAAALADLNQALRTQNAGWDAYATLAKVDPADRAAFRETFRRSLVPNYGPQNMAPLQEMLDAIVALVGPEVAGVTKVDPAAFDFKSM
ncbi:MAG: ABC transporter substrate-binding protein [Vicinamibacterales bacterium]